jgi:hypothetical protein
MGPRDVLGGCVQSCWVFFGIEFDLMTNQTNASKLLKYNENIHNAQYTLNTLYILHSMAHETDQKYIFTRVRKIANSNH